MLRSFCVFSFVTCAACVTFSPAIVEIQESQSSPERDDRIVLPADDENAVARRDFMRTKLVYTQNVFRGLTTGDFKLIKEGIREVSEITKGEAWVALDDDQYRKLTEEFKTTIKRLSEAAESGNLEATSLRFYNMSTSCIDCHQHIRNADYVF